MTTKIGFKKLFDETWGVNGPTDALVVGKVVTVAKRDGSTKEVRVTSVVEIKNGYTTARIEDAAPKVAAPKAASKTVVYRAPRANPRRDRAYSPECGDCRHLGAACKQCRFDEYDN